jgi:hypothetical protein
MVVLAACAAAHVHAFAAAGKELAAANKTYLATAVKNLTGDDLGDGRSFARLDAH